MEQQMIQVPVLASSDGCDYYGAIRSLAENQDSMEENFQVKPEDEKASLIESAIGELLTNGTFKTYDELQAFLMKLKGEGDLFGPAVKQWIDSLKSKMDTFVYGYQKEYDKAYSDYIIARDDNFHTRIWHKAMTLRKLQDDRDHDAMSYLSIAANSGNKVMGEADLVQHKEVAATNLYGEMVKGLENVLKSTYQQSNQSILGS